MVPPIAKFTIAFNTIAAIVVATDVHIKYKKMVANTNR
jgi:hypothetical protein